MNNESQDEACKQSAALSVAMSVCLERFLNWEPDQPGHIKATGDLRDALHALESYFEADAIYSHGDAPRVDAILDVSAAMRKLYIVMAAMGDMILREQAALAASSAPPVPPQ